MRQRIFEVVTMLLLDEAQHRLRKKSDHLEMLVETELLCAAEQKQRALSTAVALGDEFGELLDQGRVGGVIAGHRLGLLDEVHELLGVEFAEPFCPVDNIGIAVPDPRERSGISRVRRPVHIEMQECGFRFQLIIWPISVGSHRRQ